MLNSFQKAGRNLTDIEDDDMKPEDLKAKLLPAFELIREVVMADDCTVFLTAPQGGELSMMMMMMRDAKLPIRHVLIWKKNAPTFSMGRLDYDYQHEPILLTWGKRHKRPMNGTHKTSVWEIDKPRASVEHPTMKPPELYMNAYLNNSDVGDIAFEPYDGSGTALIASENTGRYCRAIEISPGYTAVALQRYLDSFAITPELINDR
jgi:site-specific DNA-methyltransferase (adenine-specific)